MGKWSCARKNGRSPRAENPKAPARSIDVTHSREEIRIHYGPGHSGSRGRRPVDFLPALPGQGRAAPQRVSILAELSGIRAECLGGSARPILRKNHRIQSGHVRARPGIPAGEPRIARFKCRRRCAQTDSLRLGWHRPARASTGMATAKAQQQSGLTGTPEPLSGVHLCLRPDVVAKLEESGAAQRHQCSVSPPRFALPCLNFRIAPEPSSSKESSSNRRVATSIPRRVRGTRETRLEFLAWSIRPGRSVTCPEGRR